MSSHPMSFRPAAETCLRRRLVVDRSADLVGDTFALVGAADGAEGRPAVGEPCDLWKRARVASHGARPACEHDQIEIDGAEPVAEKQRAVSAEMILDDIEK